MTMYTCKVWSESISEAFHRLCSNTAEHVRKDALSTPLFMHPWARCLK